MFDPATTDWTIYKLVVASQSWQNTGVKADTRNKSHADVLSDGNKLYIAFSNDNTAAQAIQVYRFTYNTTSKAYTSGGTPATTTALGVSFASMAKDATGKLFIAYASDNKVQYMTSSDGATWSAPAQVPTSPSNAPTAGAPGATKESDDVAALTHVGNGVGVMWSRTSSDTRIDGGFYFSVFGTTGWSAAAPAWAGNWVGDNHVSLKTAADGRVIAAVKSSLGSGGGGPSSAPLIAVLERSVAGTWSTPRNVSSVAQEGTRPMLVLDEGAKQANVFLTNPADPTMPTQGGDINRRTAPLDTLNFGTPSLGSAYIKSSANPGINDATSTKQGLNDAS
ncbi:MAG: hypothetical protein ACRDTZ_26200, partial [Pseudonocardiaceae bacterium]